VVTNSRAVRLDPSDSRTRMPAEDSTSRFAPVNAVRPSEVGLADGAGVALALRPAYRSWSGGVWSEFQIIRPVAQRADWRDWIPYGLSCAAGAVALRPCWRTAGQ